MNNPARELFQTNPAGFVEESIKDYVRRSPLNRLEAFDGAPIFDEPLVGFADGDDSIFEEYKTIIADSYLTPREVLSKHLVETVGTGTHGLSRVSVISWVLPIAKETRLANRRETMGPSLRWNHTRFLGQDFIFELSRHVVSTLEEMGQRAVAPELSPFFRSLALPNGPASTWSQRHVAYAAGLGTFSLSDGFITPKGIAMRCGSVVVDLELPPTPRPYLNHLANCLFYVDGSCIRCIERCPYGAITEKGHDKVRCRAVLYEDQRPWLDGVHGEGYIGSYASCGLCQTAVPCEDRIHPVPRRKQPERAVSRA